MDRAAFRTRAHAIERRTLELAMDYRELAEQIDREVAAGNTRLDPDRTIAARLRQRADLLDRTTVVSLGVGERPAGLY
jgi:hypothetical protein